MRTYMIWSIMFILIPLCHLSGQIEIGVKMGLFTSDQIIENFPIQSTGDQGIQLNLQNAQYGVHVGVYSRLKLFGLFIEPGIILNSSAHFYTLQQFNEGEIFSSLKTERFNNIDIPLLFGYKILIFKVFAGPVAHLQLEETKELFENNLFKHHFRKAVYGLQAGVGLDIGKLRFSTTYEGNMPWSGQALELGDHSYTLRRNPSRIIFSMGIKL